MAQKLTNVHTRNWKLEKKNKKTEIWGVDDLLARWGDAAFIVDMECIDIDT